MAITLCCLRYLIVDINHDVLQSTVHLLESTAASLTVLCHLQRRHCHTTCICCFGWHIQHVLFLEIIRSLPCGRHVCTLSDSFAAILHQNFGIFKIQLIL